MSLRFAILAALAEKSGTGIELARRFDRSYGYFWPASHQQIYREVDRLRGEGLVDSEIPDGPPQRGRPRSISITKAGRDALAAWVSELDAPPAERSPLAVRVRAAAALGTTDGLREALQHEIAVRQARLADYRQFEQRGFAADEPGRLRHAVLRGGIQLEEAWIEWAEEVLTLLDDAALTEHRDPRQ
ncbi:MAG: helix-turn-helix transcriptional regulator [Microbacterium sp.]